MQENENIVPEALISDELPAWKRLDNVVRMWVTQSLFEQDMKNYVNLQDQYR